MREEKPYKDNKFMVLLHKAIKPVPKELQKSVPKKPEGYNEKQTRSNKTGGVSSK